MSGRSSAGGGVVDQEESLKVKPFSIEGFPEIRFAEIAHSAGERMRGLIGRDSLPHDTCMLIEKCNAIHSFFMRFPFHAVFLDSKLRPVKIVRNIKPWRPFIWGGFKARCVAEIDARCGTGGYRD